VNRFVERGAVGSTPVDYTERLRRLAINAERLGEADNVGFDVDGDSVVDPKTLALARIAALVAIGGAEPSFGSLADAAVSAGATAVEIVDVLMRIIDIVGVPRAVAAAPQLATALGYDLDEGSTGEGTSGWRP
jgi:4-carboxymuconolactone decarboxylase